MRSAAISKPYKLSMLMTASFAAYCLIYLSIYFLPISAYAKNVSQSGLYLITPAFALWGCIYAFVKVNPEQKRFWLFLGLASSFLLLGEAIWVYYNLILSLVEPHFPHWAIPFLISYLFMFLTLLGMSKLKSVSRETKVRAFLDVMVVIMLASVAAWFWLLRPLYTPDAHLLEAIINRFYPVIDISILLGLSINILGFKVSRWRVWEVTIGLGFLMKMVTDIVFNSFMTADTFFIGNFSAAVLSLGWMFFYFLFGLAGVQAVVTREQRGETRFALSDTTYFWSDVAVATVIVAAIPSLMYMSQAYTESAPEYLLLISALTILALVIVVRALVLISENKRLLYSAVTDSLTGLYNHRFFQERLKAEINRAGRQGEDMSVVIIDIDNFSMINNVYGHLKGDELLCQLANKIRNNVRSSDIVCRIGGDEFVLILPCTSDIEAYKVGFNILRVMERISKFKEVGVSASAGVATFPEHATDEDELIKKADGALYWAKYHGKSQVLIYDPAAVEPFNVDERIESIEQYGFMNTVHALAAAVDARDSYTQNHSKHVSHLITVLGRKLEMDEAQIKKLETAALLHDIGKIGIPDRILCKPGMLNETEMCQIMEHPEIGKKILSEAAFAESALWIYSHHERWDGGGYPNGLKGESIPLEARMLAICDSFDAMISDRPYREAISLDDAIDEIRRGAGTQFDPDLAERFIETLAEAKTVSTATTQS